MCCLCLVSERSFLRDPQPFLKKEKKKSKKVKKFQSGIFGLFFDFFFLFSKMAVDRVKMIFQTPNKGSTCFKHHKFLNFDEKKYPQNFYTTDFKISLVPCS